jgi:xanthine dehydrogenase accessory factor
MRDVLASVEAWRARGEQIAIATVIDTWGSAPRQVGAKMALTQSGGLAGSVSAGCVESAVIDEGLAVLESGLPRVLSYGVADEDAFEVGLACGGNIRLFVEPFSALDSVYGALVRNLDVRQPMAVISVLAGAPERVNRKLIVQMDGSVTGDLALPPDLLALAIQAAQELLAQGRGGMLDLADGTALFLDVYPPVPRLIIVGAVHTADALVSMANLAGFDTIVIDPRAAFATRERFPHATEIVREWPDRALAAIPLDMSAYVAVLTHDPKLDDPALMAALRSQARYVGALGSRRTNRLRVERLKKAGFTDEELSRLHAPIGLHLGGRSPEEIAVSIIAEIVRVKNGIGAAQPESA